MRIVFILAGLGTGGAEKIVNLLAHHRLARGDSVHILAVNAESAESYFPYDEAIKVEALGGPSHRVPRIAATAYQIVSLRRRLRELAPDVVISFLVKINVLVGFAGYGLGIPIVMSERNNFYSQGMNVLWRVARPVAAAAATRLVMQTRDASRSLPSSLQARVTVIPNPVQLPDNCVHVPGDGTRIVAAGRLDRQKGFDLLLKAFKNVLQDVPEATLTIFGEGPERHDLERQIRDLGLEGSVQLPGVTKSPVSWIAAGDIFVLSSRFEGFPNALLEALMAGLATISFDCPWGPADMLSNPDTGILVPAGDVERLGWAMRSLLTDPALRKKLASAGSAMASARYEVRAVMRMWDNVIATSVRKQQECEPEAVSGRELERHIDL